MKEVTVTYHGHACFTLECGGYRAVLDPYADGMVPGCPPLSLEAEAVLCSHDHGDHASVQVVCVKDTDLAVPYTVENLDTPHDDREGALRGRNLVRIFDFDGCRIAHLGDLGTVPGPDILAKLKNVDCMMIPVGGFFTIGPEEAQTIIQLTEPSVVIPMHYRTDTTGFEVLSHLSDFTARFSGVNVCDNRATIPCKEKQILVINYKP